MANIGYVQVTRRCNQRCRFCSNPEMEIESTFEQAAQCIDILKERNYYGVILTGGEPTLCGILLDIISYARKSGLHVRIVTNGQKMADKDFLASLIDAGLEHVNISIHSSRRDVQGFLTNKEDSLDNITLTLENLSAYAGLISVDAATTINAYNADHLDETVKWVVSNFTYIRHFVWNNIDPTMNCASENRDTIPKPRDFELSLFKACSFLEKCGRTIRIEKVPLCYMAEYAHCATETRKIIKNEERTVFFLDEKGAIQQELFEYGKTDCCKVCRYNRICAGLYEMDTYYDSGELYPLFLDPQEVIRKVLEE